MDGGQAGRLGRRLGPGAAHDTGNSRSLGCGQHLPEPGHHRKASRHVGSSLWRAGNSRPRCAWFEREHEAFGIDFGAGFGERLDRLGEALHVIENLLAGGRVNHQGRFYQLNDAVCAPAPVQAKLPILIGGSGPKKTMPLVARYADLWNAFGTPQTLANKSVLLEELCARIGRDPSTIQRTVNHNVVIRDSSDQAERAWSTWASTHAVREGDGRGVIGGTPEQVADALQPFVEVGFNHLVWIFRSPWDLETIRRLPHVRAMLQHEAR